MFSSVISSRLLSVGAAAIIAVGVLGAASVAMADEPAGPGGGQGEGRERDSARRHAVIAIGKVLENAGVSREEVQQGASEGNSFGEIMTVYGSKTLAQAKIDALAALDARLAEGVAAGKLTADQAARIQSAAPAAFDKLMDAKPAAHKTGNKPGNKPGGKAVAIARHAMQTVAETLDMEIKDLVKELRQGATVAEVAGGQADEVVAALTAEANAAIGTAVADGIITTEQGAAARSKVDELINKFMNSEHAGKGHKWPGAPKTN